MDFEKLGLFYLGKPVRPGHPTRARRSRCSTIRRTCVTHAVCIGMTGSGKTGLGIALIEEAAIDGMPVLAIDPKGDLSNLLLTFPGLSAAEFAPWVNPDEARAQRAHARGVRRDRSRALEGRPGRVGRGRRAHRTAASRGRRHDLHARQPRRSAALDPRDVQRAAARPSPTNPNCCRDGCSRRPRASSRWPASTPIPDAAASTSSCRRCCRRRGGRAADLDLPTLIAQVQSPPVTKVGVLELESFFPAKDRFGLAMRLNNLLAAPGFATWLEGEPLDIAAHAVHPATASRASPSSRSRTSATPSGCSS